MPARLTAGLILGLTTVDEVVAQQPQSILEEIIVTTTRGFDQGLVSYWRSNQSLYTAEFNQLVEKMIH